MEENSKKKEKREKATPNNNLYNFTLRDDFKTQRVSGRFYCSKQWQPPGPDGWVLKLGLQKQVRAPYFAWLCVRAQAPRRRFSPQKVFEIAP